MFINLGKGDRIAAKMGIAALSLLVATAANSFDFGKLKETVRQVQKEAANISSGAPQAGSQPAPGKPTETGTAPSSTTPPDADIDCISINVQKPKYSMEGMSGRLAAREMQSGSYWEKSSSLCLNSEKVKYQSAESLKGVSLGKVDLEALRKEISRNQSCNVQLEFIDRSDPDFAKLSEKEVNRTMYWNLQCQSQTQVPYEAVKISGTKDFSESGYDTIFKVEANLVGATRPNTLDLSSEYSKAVIAKFGSGYTSTLNKEKKVLVLSWNKEDGVSITYVPGWLAWKNADDKSTILELSNSSYRDLTLKKTAQRYLAPVLEQQERQKELDKSFKPSL